LAMFSPKAAAWQNLPKSFSLLAFLIKTAAVLAQVLALAFWCPCSRDLLV
jgi:hypothetical protein